MSRFMALDSFCRYEDFPFSRVTCLLVIFDPFSSAVESASKYKWRDSMYLEVNLFNISICSGIHHCSTNKLIVILAGTNITECAEFF